MNQTTIRLVPLLIGALTLAACSDHKTKPAAEPTRTVSSSSTSTTTGSTKPRTATTSTTTTKSTRSAAAQGALPESTGIASCDEYLASYKSCHLAAGIYARDQIDSRYDMMRTSLLRQSQDPDMRDQLGNRCTSLATQLKEALHGKSCADVPAPASTR
ncbi:hypothetical protein IM816_11820 [Luteibacter flocculans]|uniref:Uncharacterized protein n=1 Tax=Luteibacter flocculans TaxID=2780091 RepID=A0ABY4SZQ5_9GAMM|nr:hypothetical protein [Luteibacter flocculans]URL57325.1 hypothetical protein IM816_11820 [Luteibacter flocculans]